MSLFKRDPLKKLQKEYERKLLEARDTQRSGDIQRFAIVNDEAETILKQIEAMKANTVGS